MAQGKALSDVQEEKLRHAFLAGDDALVAARFAECSETAARKRYRVLAIAPPDDYAELRATKTVEAIDTAVREMTDVRLLLIRAIPDKIPDADLKSVAVTIGVLTDKIQLITGASTANVTHGGTITVQVAEQIAADTGLDVAEVMAEAEHILRAAKQQR